MKKTTCTTRTALALGSLAMAATYFLPLWQIQLWAPQYPEGLNMKIWHDRLSGAFDIINGLNHYIGMREIRQEMFPEFAYLGILIGVFIAVGLVAAATGSRAWLAAFTATAFAYGGAALWDFYRWGYDYGHNLDPHAAIVVPGMSYQPPVVGYKNLLNFTAYSGPDSGGWLIIAVGAIASFLTAYEFFFRKKEGEAVVGDNPKSGVKPAKKPIGTALAAAVALASVASCGGGPVPLNYGRDECAHCRMVLTDRRFGAEILTKKGRTYPFDDLNCMAAHLKSGAVAEANVEGLFVADFAKPGTLLPVGQVFFLKNEAFKSPMAGNAAAFLSKEEREKARGELGGGEELDWEAAQKSF